MSLPTDFFICLTFFISTILDWFRLSISSSCWSPISSFAAPSLFHLSVYALNWELISLFEHMYFLWSSPTGIYFTCLTLVKCLYYRIHNFWVSSVVLVASLGFAYLPLHYQPPSFQLKYLLCSRGIWMWYWWLCSSANSFLVQELSAWCKALYYSLTRILTTRAVMAAWLSHNANIILAS